MTDATRPLSLTISGMSCGSCARRVHAALEALDGTDVEVKVGGATVTVPDDVDDAEITAAVQKLGFTVEAIAPRAV